MEVPQTNTHCIRYIPNQPFCGPAIANGRRLGMSDTGMMRKSLRTASNLSLSPGTETSRRVDAIPSFVESESHFSSLIRTVVSGVETSESDVGELARSPNATLTAGFTMSHVFPYIVLIIDPDSVSFVKQVSGRRLCFRRPRLVTRLVQLSRKTSKQVFERVVQIDTLERAAAGS
jgi:hypothetical protein